METSSIGFEGLGINPISINKVAFSISDKYSIYWYAIIITVGMILAVLFAMKFAKKVGLNSDNIIDAALWGTPFALIGARIFYIIFSLDEFMTNGAIDFIKMISVHEGGLSIFGGIAFGFITGLIVCKIKKINTLALFDVAALGFLIGQAVGRWGNFVNAEVYGSATILPWGMTINGAGPYHPLFLYESLWNVLGFAVLCVFILKFKKHAGEGFFGYMVWYGAGRACLELLRQPEFQLKVFPEDIANKLGFNIMASFAIAVGIAVVGVVLFILCRIGIFEKIVTKRALKRANTKLAEVDSLEDCDYSPVFGENTEDIPEIEKSVTDLIEADEVIIIDEKGDFDGENH